MINGEAFDKEGKLKKGLNARDFDLEHKRLKPRRASLPVFVSDFYSSLTRVDGPKGPRFIFHGILNGWPSLNNFEVMAIDRRRDNEFVGPKALLTGQRVWKHMWSAVDEGRKGIDPIIKEKGLLFRATLRGPDWSSKGWSLESPGFAFWYEPQSPEPKLNYGTKMIDALHDDPICKNVHMVAHRYAVKKETPKDMLTYHAFVLLEWDHGQYMSVIEAAYLNGLGGYKGKSNFYDDKDEPITAMYKAFPPELVCPWLTNCAEGTA